MFKDNKLELLPPNNQTNIIIEQFCTVKLNTVTISYSLNRFPHKYLSCPIHPVHSCLGNQLEQRPSGDKDLSLFYKRIAVNIQKKAPMSSSVIRSVVLYLRVSVCAFSFLSVRLSPCGIYFDSIRGSLHTPCRNQFSHSGPPVATATRAWCWVT